MSFVERSSLSRRVPYQKFHCSLWIIVTIVARRRGCSHLCLPVCFVSLEYLCLASPFCYQGLYYLLPLLTGDLKQVAQAVTGIDLQDSLVTMIFTLFDENS